MSYLKIVSFYFGFNPKYAEYPFLVNIDKSNNSVVHVEAESTKTHQPIIQKNNSNPCSKNELGFPSSSMESLEPTTVNTTSLSTSYDTKKDRLQEKSIHYCEPCAKSFSRKGKLDRHILRHDKENASGCDLKRKV